MTRYRSAGISIALALALLLTACAKRPSLTQAAPPPTGAIVAAPAPPATPAPMPPAPAPAAPAAPPAVVETIRPAPAPKDFAARAGLEWGDTENAMDLFSSQAANDFHALTTGRAAAAQLPLR